MTRKARLLPVVMLLLVAMVCRAADDAPKPPESPRVFLTTSLASTAATGKTIRVEAGGDFQAALDKAQPGDEIVLSAGATFTGNFVLPAKEGSGKWITIRFGFGRHGPAVDGGQNTFAEAFPGSVFEKNLLVGYGEGRAEHAKNKSLPAGFLFEPKHVGAGPEDNADWAAVGFANFAGGDYRLTGGSKYRATGTDGKALGADIDVLEAARKRGK